MLAGMGLAISIGAGLRPTRSACLPNSPAHRLTSSIIGMPDEGGDEASHETPPPSAATVTTALPSCPGRG